MIIDDKCLAVPNLQHVKTYADVILYSTGYSKIVDLGFGGFAQINRDVKYKKHTLQYNEFMHEELVKDYKQNLKERSPYIYKDSEWLDNSIVKTLFEEYSRQVEREYRDSIKMKNRINKIYADNLPDRIKLDPEFQLWRFNIKVPNRDEIINMLFENNLFASTHYASLKGYSLKAFPLKQKSLHSNIINLFNDKNFSEEKAYQTVTIINNLI